MTTNERGFSLAEVLAALFILALSAVLLGEAIGTTIKSWERTGSRIQSVEKLAKTVELIGVSEAHLKADITILDGPVLIIENGLPLQLASPHLDKNAECEFDMIGRRCR